MNQTTKSQDVITLVENNPIIVIAIILLLVSGLIICCCLLLTIKYSQARKNIELARRNSEKLFKRKQPIVRATRTVQASTLDSQEMSPLNKRPLPVRPFSEYITRPDYMNRREAEENQQSTSYKAQVHQPMNKSNTLTNENLEKIGSLYETPIA